MGLLNVEANGLVFDYSPESFEGGPPTDSYRLDLLITDAATGQPRDGVGQDDIELISIGDSPTKILVMSGFLPLFSQHGLYTLTVGGMTPMLNGPDSIGIFVTMGADRGQTLCGINIQGRPRRHEEF